MANPPPYEEENNEFVIGDDEEANQFEPPAYEEDDIHNAPQPEEFGAFEPKGDEVEIDNPVSAVASAPAKNILILIIMTIAAGFFLYKYVFKEAEEVTAEKKKQQQIAEQPVENAQAPTRQDERPQVNIGVVDTPELPTMENVQPPPPLIVPEIPKEEVKLEVPPPAPTPPPVPEVLPEKELELPKKVEEAAIPIEEIPSADEVQAAGPSPEERKMARRKSSMLVMNGGGVPALADKLDPDAVGPSGVSPIKATKVQDLSLMILQGKMLDAVLETTINTDLPGSLRAVISRDVYAESGKTILIPRGSRLIGSYNSGVKAGQQRIIVTWGRVIRPDGVDIQIDSEGTDQLGRAGMTGIVDNKYLELFGNSLLVSAVTIGGSILLNSVQEAQTVSTSTSTGSAATGGGTTTTQTASPTDASVMQAAQNLSDTAKKLVEGQSTQPTIIVNQGARVKVFVNKDLIFPASVVKRVSSGN